MALETVGVKVVAQDADKATKQVSAFQKQVTQTQSAISKSATQAGASGQLFSAASKSMQQMGSSALGSIPGIGGMAQNLVSAGGAAGGMAAGLSAAIPVIGGLAVAVGGLTLGLKLFWQMGKRSTEVTTTLQAFGNAVSSLGDSTKVLQSLREQTRGTVSDVELMRLTIASLQGTSETFRKVVGPRIGEVLDVTARAARATGQSVDVVREKFLTGLRLMSKRRIDDIGVILDQKAAEEAYAKSIGKTAAELNNLEKQAAFAQGAIAALGKIGAEAGMNTTAENIARIGVLFENFKDRASLLIAPVFDVFVDHLAKIASGFQFLMEMGTSMWSSISNAVQTVVGNLGELKTALFGSGEGTNFLREGITYAVAAITIFADTIATINTAIKNALLPAFKFVGGLISSFFGGLNKTTSVSIAELAFNLGRGGANIIGSFAAGLARGGTFVLQAVTKIAQIVADFLMGFSPPKMGPLREIDKGGENVAIAWADGFVSGIMQPVEQVAAEVNNRLGVIAQFSREQVAAGFARLDEAIRPFKESLSIAKADMEAIAGFVDPALRSVERQRKGILKQFNMGTGEGDINALRQFDMQASRLKQLKELGEERNDQAEIQLGIASAMQAQERALLAIQQARLGTAEKTTEETVKSAKETSDALDKAKKEGGGSGAGGAESGGATPFQGGAPPDLFANEALDRARAQIQNVLGQGAAGIAQGLAESGAGAAIGGLATQAGDLQFQLARIQKSNPVQSLVKKFEGLTSGVSNTFSTLKDSIEENLGDLFGEEGKIAGYMNTVQTLFDNTFVKEGSAFQLAKLGFTTFKEDVDRIFKAAFGDEGTVTAILNTIGEKFTLAFGEESPLALAKQAFADFKTDVEENLTSLFGEEGILGVKTANAKLLFEELRDTVNSTMEEVKTTLQGVFETPESIVQKIPGLITTVLDAIIAQFSRLTGTGEGTLSAALASLSDVFHNGIVAAGVAAFNNLLKAAENAINSVIRGVLRIPGAGMTGLSEISITPIEVPGAARGALGLRGTFMAGERGAELITTHKPATVFPAQATRALQALAAQPMPQNIYGGGDSYSTTNNNSVNANINVPNTRQAVLAQRQLLASMR